MSEITHFVGIGGSGMSGIARALARQGKRVTGSDLRESPVLEALRREPNLTAWGSHAPDQVRGASLVVTSAAVKPDNPEIQAAQALGIPIISRAEMLGRLMSRYRRSVAVSGTHGKTTTTGMVALVLEAGGLDPTVLIGGDLPAYGGNARLGSSDVFVAESCEAYDSFLDLDPYLAVITNIEADHLDYYGDFDNVLRSFRQFLSQVTGAAIVCGDDPGVQAVLELLPSLRTVRYGFGEGMALRACQFHADGLRPSYTACWEGETLGRITLSVPGAHNVLNSLSAVGIGLELGLPFARIQEGLEAFTGTGRRFEQLGETANGVLVIDDYAHHPTELRATLAAAKQAFPDRRRIAVFQPHLPSRTEDFQAEFAESFGDADLVVLTEIYLAREQARAGVSGATLAALTADRRGAEHIVYVADKTQLPAKLAQITRSGDVVLTLGAGDIRAAGEGLLRGTTAP